MPAAARIRRKPGLRLLLLVAGVLLVLGVGSAFGYRAVRDSSLFAVKHVVVRGASPSLEAQVEEAVRSSAGTRSLLALSPASLARAVEVVPGVHVARVDRDFPSTLRVRVWPERAVAVAVSGHDRVVVSATGRVLSRIGRRERPPELPRVGLSGRGVPKPGSRIQDAKVLAQLAAVYAIPPDFGARVGWVRLGREHGLEVDLKWPKLPIRLGPAVDLHKKLLAAALVLRAYPTSSARAGLTYVDVSAPARPAVMSHDPDPATASLGKAVEDPSQTASSAPSGDATTASASANP